MQARSLMLPLRPVLSKRKWAFDGRDPIGDKGDAAVRLLKEDETLCKTLVKRIEDHKAAG